MNSTSVDCVRPGAVTAEDIVAYVDGEAPARVVDHLRGCPVCQAEASRAAQTQRRLRHALYRFDCPSPQTLGDYALTVLEPDAQRQAAAHIMQCPRCTEELQTLRSFLSVEPALQPGPLERLKRVVATLISPPDTAPAMAYAGLRGTDASAVQTYQAGGLTITLSASPKTRRGPAILSGLILRDGGGSDAAPEVAHDAIAGGEVVLIDAAGASRTEPLDALGNFAFEIAKTGTYRLEVRLPDQIVIVEEVQVGG
jgi:hypothetical protein